MANSNSAITKIIQIRLKSNSAIAKIIFAKLEFNDRFNNVLTIAEIKPKRWLKPMICLHLYRVKRHIFNAGANF